MNWSQVRQAYKMKKLQLAFLHSIELSVQMLIFTRYQPNSDYSFNILKAVAAIFMVTLLMTIANSFLQPFHMYP